MSAENRAPRATVVTALHEYRACEELWLQAMANQTVPADQFEVIGVDAVGHPTYANLLDRLPHPRNVIYERIPPHGRARALNHALTLAQGSLIVFVADDFVVDADFIETHLHFHEAHPEPEAVAIAAAFIPPELSTEFTRWLEETGRFFGVPFRESMTEIPEDFFYVGNASVKRKLLDRAGVFDEIFLNHAGDDFEYGQRLRKAGMKAHFLPAATAIHHHRVTLVERAEAYLHMGQNARALAKRAGEDSWLRSLRLSAPIWSSRVAAARAAMFLKNSSETRTRWWRMTLDAAFAEGYRRGHNGDRPQ